ncbi:MAG: FHA domain-containing protein [Anaerolineales bacterium]|nr:FHA domain-containing protein [Anaerolineales bacterium]
MEKSRYRLEVIKGFEEGLVFPLDSDEISIGRGEDNDFTIPIAEVSRHHALLIKDDNGFMIKDLGSTNGTFIDRKKIGGKYLLSAGDVIMLGDAVHLLFKAEADLDSTLASTPPAPTRVPEPPPPPPEEELINQEPPPTSPDPKQGLEEIQEEDLEGREAPRPWLWAGIGCLVVIIFLIVLGLIAFDYLNLYCTPPFDTLLDFLYTCPAP